MMDDIVRIIANYFVRHRKCRREATLDDQFRLDLLSIQTTVTPFR